MPILKSIAIHFKVPNVTSLSWAIAGYALTLGVYILVSRRLGEVFGPKYIFLLGLASSALWAIVDGASFYSIPAVFIASRSFQGLGIALTLPTGLVLLGKTNPPGIGKELRSVIYRLMAPVGLVIGALGASLILNQTSWSAVYWAYFVVLVMLVIAGGLTLPSVPDRQDALSQPSEIVSELDIAGMMAGVCSLVLFGFAWVQADRVGWKQPYIWVALIMSVVFVMLFAVIERFYAANPLVPRSVQSGEISMILVAVGAGSSCFGIWIFYGWQFLESLKLVSPLVVSYLIAEHGFRRPLTSTLDIGHRLLCPSHGHWLRGDCEHSICASSAEARKSTLWYFLSDDGGMHSPRDTATRPDLLGATVRKRPTYGMESLYQDPGGYYDGFSRGEGE